MSEKIFHKQLWHRIFDLLPRKQKAGFFVVLVILGVSAGLSQLTPLACPQTVHPGKLR